MANVKDIEGIGPVLAGKLEKAGIVTVESLLESGATRSRFNRSFNYLLVRSPKIQFIIKAHTCGEQVDAPFFIPDIKDFVPTKK
jgi:hypothetical protein